MTLADVAEILEAAAARARELDARARAEHRDWIDQAASPLGRRRHALAVRRRVAAGGPGAAIVGRRLLLNEQALGEELARLSTKRPKDEAPRPETAPERIARRLGLVRGGAQ